MTDNDTKEGDVNYTIELHKHRFAAWAASTAARASKLCRFDVETGVAILETAGFTPELSAPECLPSPDNIDATHLKWRERLIAAAKDCGITFTHGVAAKLVNTYLKVRFVCGGYHEHPHVMCLHPPIDSLLLNGLADNKVGGAAKAWRKFNGWRWSKFSSEQYQEVIDQIRRALPDTPLWSVEKYWQGHQ